MMYRVVAVLVAHDEDNIVYQKRSYNFVTEAM